MKKLLYILIIVYVLFFMYGEYRFIMMNLKPYVAKDGTVFIECFGQVDVYDAEQINESAGFSIPAD